MSASPEVLQIPALVLRQLQTGSVWTDRDFMKNHEGLRVAVAAAGSARGVYAAAILGCLASEDLLVRTGAVAVLDAVARDLGAERITTVLQAFPERFRGVKPAVPIAFADLEWAAVAAYQDTVGPNDTKTLAYFREVAESQSWRMFVLPALARFDGDWVVAHARLVAHDNFAVLWALSPANRRKLIAALSPYPPEKPDPFGLNPWEDFPAEETRALRALMWPA
ncbi:MAG: hypothetical protein WCK55_19825 [Verrucomicrobiota bacterium]